MPLPLAVLRAAQNQPIMVELKNGDTLSGILSTCDGFMNLNMKELVCTSRDGDKFWKLPECYVRGNNVKYFRLANEVLEQATTNATIAATGAVGQDRQSQAGAGPSSGARGRGRSSRDWHPSGRGRGRGRGVDLSANGREAKFQRVSNSSGRGGRGRGSRD